MNRPTVLCAAFLFSLLIQTLPARVFTDDGGRQVDAELVGVRDGHAILSRQGAKGRWPVNRLSTADQAYVREWARNPPFTSKLNVRIWERDGIGPSGTVAEQSGLPGPPKNIPLIQQTQETAKYKHYDVDITNSAEMDAANLSVAYVLYVIGPDGKVGSDSGNTPVSLIEAGKRETVTTKGVSYVRTKTTTMTLNFDRIGGLSTGSDTSRSKERFGGAWVRVYGAGGSMIGEAKQLHPELERLKPAWTGPAGSAGQDEEIPLLKALDAFEELIEKLRKLPGAPPPPPSGGPPKPPGFPR